MNSRSICVLIICLLAQTAMAQSVLDKHINDRLETIAKQNMEAAKSTGEYSGVSADEIAIEIAKNDAIAQQDTKLHDQGGRISGEVDIKKIRLGMSQKEVRELIGQPIDENKSARTGCFTATPLMNDLAHFKNGDFIIFCEQTFSYAGQIPELAFFYFDQDKLRHVHMESFFTTRHVDSNDSFPEIVRALTTSKYQVEPHVVLIDRSNRGETYEYSWIDSKDNRLIYSALVNEDLSGYVFKNEFVDLVAPDHNQYRAKRENIVLRNVQEIMIQQAAQKANDL